jgi:hypothetical protein
VADLRAPKRRTSRLGLPGRAHTAVEGFEFEIEVNDLDDFKAVEVWHEQPDCKDGRWAERPEIGVNAGFLRRTKESGGIRARFCRTPRYQPTGSSERDRARAGVGGSNFVPAAAEGRRGSQTRTADLPGRAVAMLRRYMRYAIETGRLLSLVGREFFRAKVALIQW